MPEREEAGGEGDEDANRTRVPELGVGLALIEACKGGEGEVLGVSVGLELGVPEVEIDTDERKDCELEGEAVIEFEGVFEGEAPRDSEDVGEEVGVAVRERVEEGEEVIEFEGVFEGEAPRDSEDVGEEVGVAVRERVEEEVGVGPGESEDVGEGVREDEEVSVTEREGVMVGVGVIEAEDPSVRVDVGVGLEVGVMVGVTEEVMVCGAEEDGRGEGDEMGERDRAGVAEAEVIEVCVDNRGESVKRGESEDKMKGEGELMEVGEKREVTEEEEEGVGESGVVTGVREPNDETLEVREAMDEEDPPAGSAAPALVEEDTEGEGDTEERGVEAGEVEGERLELDVLVGKAL